MGEVLYVGGDDSNHAGENTKGEFIVAVFSFLHEDSIVKTFSNRRDYGVVSGWLKNPERDYRFTLRTSEQYRHNGLNLPVVMPSLISSFLENRRERLDQINIYLDGRLDAESKQYLREEVSEIVGVKNVVVANFIKKKKLPKMAWRGKSTISKRPCCPTVVYAADVIANSLYNYNGPIAGLFKHDKMIRESGLFENL